MNRTRNRSGSTEKWNGVTASIAMIKPRAIWMSGAETRGTSWSRTDDTRTAASKSKIRVNASKR